jgi:phosphoglycolate phosphatase
MSKLVLFDIDGTLVLTGGAGVRAMNRACTAVLGIEDALAGVEYAGRTDWSILHDALEKAGLQLDSARLDAIRTRYISLLQEEIQHRGTGVKAVLSGIRPLLDSLAAQDDVFLGLLTGNFQEAARIKLEYFDLWRFFRCGAFGDDSRDRNALVPFALTRARACGLSDTAADHVFVIGDTPNDIACAHAGGAISVAVATGNFSADQLRESGARHVFGDLSDTTAFLSLL